jgi:Asp/Glu/hydantoin racemase
MNNPDTPITGCSGCATSAGRMCCPYHGRQAIAVVSQEQDVEAIVQQAVSDYLCAAAPPLTAADSASELARERARRAELERRVEEMARENTLARRGDAVVRAAERLANKLRLMESMLQREWGGIARQNWSPEVATRENEIAEWRLLF